MGTLDHCHTYSCPDMSLRRQKTVAKARRKLLIAVFLTMIFVMGEVIGGYMSDSLAIMTDAAHMLSDLGSFIVGLLAIKLGSRDVSLYQFMMCFYLHTPYPNSVCALPMPDGKFEKAKGNFISFKTFRRAFDFISNGRLISSLMEGYVYIFH